MSRTYATVDEAGNRYTIHEHHSRISTGSLDTSGGSMEGLASYSCNGGAVNRLDETTFEIVATGTVVTLDE